MYFSLSLGSFLLPVVPPSALPFYTTLVDRFSFYFSSSTFSSRLSPPALAFGRFPNLPFRSVGLLEPVSDSFSSSLYPSLSPISSFSSSSSSFSSTRLRYENNFLSFFLFVSHATSLIWCFPPPCSTVSVATFPPSLLSFHRCGEGSSSSSSSSSRSTSSVHACMHGVHHKFLGLIFPTHECKASKRFLSSSPIQT